MGGKKKYFNKIKKYFISISRVILMFFCFIWGAIYNSCWSEIIEEHIDVFKMIKISKKDRENDTRFENKISTHLSHVLSVSSKKDFLKFIFKTKPKLVNLKNINRITIEKIDQQDIVFHINKNNQFTQKIDININEHVFKTKINNINLTRLNLPHNLDYANCNININNKQEPDNVYFKINNRQLKNSTCELNTLDQNIKHSFIYALNDLSKFELLEWEILKWDTKVSNTQKRFNTLDFNNLKDPIQSNVVVFPIKVNFFYIDGSYVNLIIYLNLKVTIKFNTGKLLTDSNSSVNYFIPQQSRQLELKPHNINNQEISWEDILKDLQQPFSLSEKASFMVVYPDKASTRAIFKSIECSGNSRELFDQKKEQNFEDQSFICPFYLNGNTQNQDSLELNITHSKRQVSKNSARAIEHVLNFSVDKINVQKMLDYVKQTKKTATYSTTITLIFEQHFS